MISEKVWKAEEVVNFAFKHGVQKEPWHGMEYSNTGYVGWHHHRARNREALLLPSARTDLNPLGMRDTWVGTHEKFPIDREARGYMHVDPDGKPQWNIQGGGDPVDSVGTRPSGSHCRAPMLQGTWYRHQRMWSLFSLRCSRERSSGQKQLGEMKDNLRPASFPGSKVVANGHGLLVSRYGDIDVKGHLGQIPGHSSLMGRDERTGVTAMLIQNSGAADFEAFFLNGINEPFGEIFHATRKGANLILARDERH